jgi:hypothetical protein
MKYMAKYRKADGGVVDFWSGPDEVEVKDLESGGQTALEITEEQFNLCDSVTERDGRLRWAVSDGVFGVNHAHLFSSAWAGPAPAENTGVLQITVPPPAVKA